MFRKFVAFQINQIPKCRVSLNPMMRSMSMIAKSTTAKSFRFHNHMSPHLKKQTQSNIFQMFSRGIMIQTATTPNPLSLKFIPGEIVLDESLGAGMDFTPGSPELQYSELARNLFKISSVTRVFFGKEFISITKTEDEDWEDLKLSIYACIMDYYASGKPIVTDKPIISDTTIFDDDDEVVAMIKELLETRVRPAVQEDGGDIFYCGFDPDTGIVKLQLAGSCAGCPSSSITLKNGVENMLMHYIPEVRGIQEVEDDALKALNEKEFQSLEDKLRAAGIPTE